MLYIVDDDVSTCKLLENVCSEIYSDIVTYQDSREFYKVTIQDSDVIVLDLMMPFIDGIEILRRLSDESCKAKLILISGHDTSVLKSSEELAYKYGLNVVAKHSKPVDINMLTYTLLRILGKSEVIPFDKNKVSSNSLLVDHQDLLDAIKNNELILHYQPQIDLKKQNVIGVESLVRWQHPKYGLLYPDVFIDVAERSGVIDELTNEVINLAILQEAYWKEQGLDIKISVNISANNVTTLSLPERLEYLISSVNIEPSSIIFEVTESALMGELIKSLDILTRIRLKGFGLSIDDFGTGYSSLQQLHRIPFSELKIDRSFVNKMSTDPESFAIVETCTLLGHKLGMNVVAEGVEDQETWMLLLEMGCDIAQGYYISRPIAGSQLIDWIKNENYKVG